MAQMIQNKIFFIALFFTVFNIQMYAESSSEAISKPHTPASIKIILLGDSLTAGYGISSRQAYPAIALEILHKSHPNIEFVQASISGSTTASGLSRMRWQLQTKPSHILLALGSNDALRGFPLTEIQKNVEAMILEAQKHHVVPLLAGLRAPPNMGANYANQFTKIFQNLAQKHKIALWDFMLKDVGGERDKNLPDGIHPNVLGHKIMGRYFAQFLQSALKLSSSIQTENTNKTKKTHPTKKP